MNNQVERKYKSFNVDETQNRRKPKGENKLLGRVVLVRALISIVLAALLVFTLAWTWLYTIAHGPSDAMRERLVREAYEAGAEWIPALVLPSDVIDELLGKAGD
ncbi:MAG: hypothetical protein ACI3XI_07140 [Eubacteriales bacterium]